MSALDNARDEIPRHVPSPAEALADLMRDHSNDFIVRRGSGPDGWGVWCEFNPQPHKVLPEVYADRLEAHEGLLVHQAYELVVHGIRVPVHTDGA